MKTIRWTMVAAPALLIVLIGAYVRFVLQTFFADTGEIDIYVGNDEAAAFCLKNRFLQLV